MRPGDRRTASSESYFPVAKWERLFQPNSFEIIPEDALTRPGRQIGPPTNPCGEAIA